MSWQQEQASASVTVAIREERQPGGWRERCHYRLSDLEGVWGGARGRKRLNIQAITQPEEITSLSASEHHKFKPSARLEIRTGTVKESEAC